MVVPLCKRDLKGVKRDGVVESLSSRNLICNIISQPHHELVDLFVENDISHTYTPCFSVSFANNKTFHQKPETVNLQTHHVVADRSVAQNPHTPTLYIPHLLLCEVGRRPYDLEEIIFD